MQALRGGLIGCGFFASNHLHGWRDIQGVDIVTLCDLDYARLETAGKLLGVAKQYTNARLMLESEALDFVDIATTASTHKQLVEMAAANKMHVICQKPFALNMADAKYMVQACASAGVSLMVHENFRWQSPITAVKAILDSGEIGRPFWGRVSFRSAYDVFSGQPYLAEGERFIIEDLGIHSLDIARYLFGDANAITARTHRVNSKIKGEDVATMLLDHGHGVTSVVDCSYATLLETELFPQTLVEIDGSDGTLRLGADYGMKVTTRSGTRRLDVSPPLLPWAERPWHNIQESVKRIQEHWVDCLRTGREPLTSGRDNLMTLALVEGAYESAQSGQTVNITKFIA